jgi:hypothetical protein
VRTENSTLSVIMDTRRTVDNFLHHGKVLFHLLQTETENLNDLDVQLLRSQLHVLEIQISNLQAFRQLRSKDAETTETATYLEQLRSGD